MLMPVKQHVVCSSKHIFTKSFHWNKNKFTDTHGIVAFGKIEFIFTRH